MQSTLGIDTGTTSISVAAVNEAHELIESRTVNHEAFIPGSSHESRIQDPSRIHSLAYDILASLTSKHGRPSAIGFTGQMHGILYVNAQGEAVSPLYTWQDTTGNDSLPLLREHGLKVSPGYGMATHLHLQKAGKIPHDAVKLSTISDYIAMKLCGNTAPVLSSDMAASWGCFDLNRREFMTDALISAGVNVSYLPEVLKGYEVIGHAMGKIPVICSMGDNQASFNGSVKDRDNTLLLNIGTGSQVSFMTREYVDACGDIELRPYGDAYVLAGAALCGGRAYAMLERFDREICGKECYGMMSSQAGEFLSSGLKAWEVDTRFSGTRSEPGITGSIRGITEENFKPGALTVGVIRGILQELHGMYEAMRDLTGGSASVLVGSGNGLRKNEIMQRLAGEMFGMRLVIPDTTEEAACGCAICASEVVV